MTSTNTNLDEVNNQFHGVYVEGRKGAETEGVVMVLLGDNLHVVDGDLRKDIAVTSKEFHNLKSIAHAPIAIYVTLSIQNAGEVPQKDLETLHRIRKGLAGAISAYNTESDSELSRQILTDCLVLIDHVQEAKALDLAALEAFARTMGQALLRLTEIATALQLDSLHHGVQTALEHLSAKKRKTLHVVVVGDHQGRERSFAMQYFLKRFAEPEGKETHVTYAENVATVEEALALVGTQRLDRKVARSFFGDSKRLQRDVLGDAAEAILRSLSFDPIRTDCRQRP